MRQMENDSQNGRLPYAGTACEEAEGVRERHRDAESLLPVQGEPLRYLDSSDGTVTPGVVKLRPFLGIKQRSLFRPLTGHHCSYTRLDASFQGRGACGLVPRFGRSDDSKLTHGKLEGRNRTGAPQFSLRKAQQDGVGR